ncbi:type II secretion system protein N [Sphingomonas canadensis]|uniref:Type II secretion system protein N n=1 Tax=Sphingomonas canadensis TaxID=1219257 RepID=A0ABW3H810_9SPHN|nr:type II secretion system protein N [Sphingomonas canadensis]MCW3835742.1 signaling protein [Sphingomonas canadensis]
MPLPKLSPRQAGLAVTLFTAAVVVSVAVALAGLTWRIAGHAGTGPVPPAMVAKGGGAAAGPGPSVNTAPFGKAADGGASQPTALPLVLHGIVAADPQSLSAAFIAVNGQPPAPFSIGQNVAGATIQSILRDRVILSNGGRAEYLAFPDPAQQPPAGAGAAPAAPAPGTPNAPPAPAPAPVIKAAPAAADPVGPLLQRLGATRADGGFRINSAAVPGLEPGDVILSVNGTPLSDPTAAGAAFSAAQSAGSATVQVARGGNRLTITIPLR